MANKKATALVDPMSGRAVITEPNGKVFIIEIKKSNKPKDGKGVHVGMFLQPALSNIVGCDPGEYPYKKFCEDLKSSVALHEAVNLFLYMLDPKMSPDFRKESREFLEEDLVNDPHLEAELTAIVLKIPLPKKFDVGFGTKEGKVGELVRQAASKWRN